jgi:phenylalanyl-tRNA synthetase beta chain
MRPISNVVDASNYVMLEMGKPTHTFDAAAVNDRTIIVRRGRVGERLVTLDHVVRDLDPETLVIADPREVIGIAGVMGGAASEVTDATTDVVIESAIFDPVSIRRTGQRYALRSEASLRFEKGQDIPTARIGADRVAQLVAAWSGGAVHPGRVDTNPVEPPRSRVAFRPARIERILGARVAAAEQRALLARVDIETEEPTGPIVVAIVDGAGGARVDAGPGDALVALVPTWRQDIAIEADVAEEVARVLGYDAVPTRTPETLMPSYRPSPLGVRHAIRHALVGAGLSEVVSHALVAPHSLVALPWPDDAPLPAGETPSGGPVITVRNPLSAQHSVLRRHLVPSLLDLLVTNERHGRERIALFEVGKGYAADADGPREWWRLAFLLAGDALPAAWNRQPRPYDLDDAKAVAEIVAERLALAPPTYAPDRRGSPFHPGRAATVVASLGPSGGGPRAAGFPATPDAVALGGLIAELHPDILEAWEVRTPRVVVGEIAIAGLGGGVVGAVSARPVPRVPAVDRDLAAVVGEAVEAGAVVEAARRAAGALLRDVRLFDVYRGESLGPAEKSLAIRLTLQSPDATLTDEEIEAVVRAVTDALVRDVGARIRT